MSDSITREEMLLNSIANSQKSNLSPITREEQYLSYIAGETNTYPIKPITRKEFYLDKIAKSDISGGGSGINVQPLTIKENGTYYAPQGIAYSPIIVDVQVGNGDTSVLEGDGSEYYTLAPTALSFRSTAPLAEFQEVQVNGDTVDPANYTLEEGSTIVKLSIDYLKTLNTGNYEVSVVSKNTTVKGNFAVKAPELNEHGFYYNQPYTADVYGFGTTAFFVREDGTYDIIVVGRYPETGEYTITDNNIVATHPQFGTLTCTISADGTEIYCNEMMANFTLGSEIFVADEDYIYTYKEELGGYEVKVIDKTKAEYGAIKTGINGKRTVMLADEMFGEYGGSNYNLNAAPTIPDSVTDIGESAFYGCYNLTSVIIGNGVVTIGEFAFTNCFALTNIVIPNSVTTIGYHAFDNCKNLASVTIGQGVVSIGAFAFQCFNLSAITFNGTIAQWNAVEKDTCWNNGVPATYVQCSDGQVAL